MIKRKEEFSIPYDGKSGCERSKNPYHLRGLYLVYNSIWELQTQILTAGESGFLEDEVRSNLLEDLRSAEQRFRILLESLEEG